MMVKQLPDGTLSPFQKEIILGNFPPVDLFNKLNHPAPCPWDTERHTYVISTSIEGLEGVLAFVPHKQSGYILLFRKDGAENKRNISNYEAYTTYNFVLAKRE